MKTPLLLTTGCLWLTLSALAAPSPQFVRPALQTNREALLVLSSTAGTRYRLQCSSNLVDWQSMATLQSTGAQQHLDSAAPYQEQRFYRAFQTESNALTGDYFATTNGDIVMHLFNHASFLMTWNGLAIYVDPTTLNLPAQGFPTADLLLVTHEHSDHRNNSAISALTNSHTVIIAPALAASQITNGVKTLTALTTVLTNGMSTDVGAVRVEAVPAYNLVAANHPKGVGNGYLLTIGGQRIYISGDTDDTPELKSLTNIDVAFVCMSPPFTMHATNAAAAMRIVRPRIVYPYHYNTYDPAVMKQRIGTDLGIEVRLRKWE